MCSPRPAPPCRLFCLPQHRKLLIGNLGDCEAVLCRGDDFVHMSPVHNPARPCENERILAANGWVTTERVRLTSNDVVLRLKELSIGKSNWQATTPNTLDCNRDGAPLGFPFSYILWIVLCILRLWCLCCPPE